MRHAMKTPPAILLGSLLIVCIGLVTSIYGQNPPPGHACGLSIQNNRKVLKQLSKIFEKESNIVIVEYTITFRNASDGNDFSKNTRKYSFQPWKWYRTQGPESSRLLLTYEMLFGIVRFILSVGIESVDLVVDVNTPGCLKTLANGTSENVIRDYLLTDLERSVSQEESSSKDVNICTGKFSHINDKWHFVFSCCSIDHDNGGFINCYEVEKNGWDSLLLFTIILITLFFPSFLPLDSTRNRVDSYIHTVPVDKSVTLNIVLTQHPNSFRYPPDQIIQEEAFKNLCSTEREERSDPNADMLRSDLNVDMLRSDPNVHMLRSVPNVDMRYQMRVKSVCLDVPLYRLYREDRSTISLCRIVSDFVKDKFSESETGQSDGQGCEHADNSRRRCSKRRCTIKSFVTFYAMLLIALPSLPVAIAAFNKNLWAWQMIKELEELSGEKYSLNITFIRVYFVIAYLIYAIVPVVILKSDENSLISEMFKNMTNQREIRDTREKKMKKLKECLYSKVNDCSNGCISLLPIILIIRALFYVFITIVALFFTSHINIIYAVFWRKFRSIWHKNGLNEHKNKNKWCQLMKLYLIFMAFFFMMQVVFFGAMFLLFVFISITLLIVIEVNFLNKIIPVIIVLLFYVRDSYKKVGSRFDKFMGHLLEDQLFNMSYICVRDLNNMFKVICNEPSSIKINQSKMWLESKHPFLFVSKDNIKLISKDFFYHCSEMNCKGAPGALSENYINETKRLIKIGLFLVFVFLIVMAYGSYVFIAPDKYLIITFISGLVPKFLEMISTRQSDVKLDERFHRSLEEKISNFKEEWPIKKMHVEFNPAQSEEIDLIVVQNY